MRVFIIDDSTIVAKIAVLEFEKAGHVALATTSPFGATNKAKKFDPDIILLDYNMPALSGDGLLPLLREQTDAVIVYHTGEDILVGNADGIIPKSEDVVALTVRFMAGRVNKP
jgi:DNA-binding response OmpR family regulator